MIITQLHLNFEGKTFETIIFYLSDSHQIVKELEKKYPEQWDNSNQIFNKIINKAFRVETFL